MSLRAIAEAAAQHQLFVSGALHGDDGAGNTIVLLSPAEPGFWAHLRAQPEWLDGADNPVDRWSVRVVSEMAVAFNGRAVFPFGGPPYQPFLAWAERSGRAWPSPVTMLVHDTMGLFASYRGALVVPGRLALPPTPPASPCESCEAKPCLSACPPRALTGLAYDVPACHAFLDTPEGSDCLNGGCRVRRACPVSENYGRLAEQSAYHMRLFHR